MDNQQSMNQDSSNKTWYIVVAVIIIAAIAFWYYSAPKPIAGTETTAGQAQTAALTSGNTTADIAADLAQIPDVSAALTQDAAVSAQSVQGF